MKLFCLALLLSLLGCAHHRVKRIMTANEWVYEISSPMHIKLTFVGQKEGQTKLRLPEEWGGEKNLERSIRNLKVQGGRLKVTEQPSLYLVDHDPGELLEVQYDVIQPYEGKLTNENKYLPRIHSNYFLLIGDTFLVTPETNNEEKIKVRLEWKGFPQAFKLVNSFGTGLVQNFEGKKFQFTSALFLGGDYTEKIITIYNHPVYVMIHGKPQFDLDQYYGLVEKVVKNEREFFQDFEYPHYLIAFTETDEDCCGAGGTGRTNSFAMWMNESFKTVDEFQHLLAHELFHNWNGRKIHREEPEELVYWFSEGMTDYYAGLLNLRSGVISFEKFVEMYNTDLRNYHTSKVRNFPNDVILKDFWRDRQVSRLPYWRGRIMATEWNVKIKEKNNNKSLDNFFLDFYKEAQSLGTLIGQDSVARILSPYLSYNPQKDIDSYINKGKDFKLSAKALGPCAVLETKKFPTLYYGFDVSASKSENRILKLSSDSPLSKLGIKEGEKLAGWSMNSDANSEQEVRIEREGKKISFKFFPRGKAVKVPQYKIIKNDETCLTWFR